MQAPIVPIVVAAAWLASPVAAFSQAVERAQDLKSFSTLELNGCFDTKLVAGARNGIVVTATSEQHDKIRIEQAGDVVTVGPTDRDWSDFWNGWCRDGSIKILVTANFAKDSSVDLRVRGSGDLDADVPAAASLMASVAGSGDLSIRGSAGDCGISIAGSGDVQARTLECSGETEVEVHGSGDATLQGKTKTCSFEVHGSGDVAATDYACESAEVAIHGSGSIGLANVSDLAVEIHGSGDVRYRGEPKVRRLNVHGSGELRKL
jgi:hypothetical protein